MRKRRAMILAAAVFVVALTPSVAWGWAEGGATYYTSCADCHGATGFPVSDATADTRTVAGPHKGYTSTSRKCAVCHKTHEVMTPNISLLPWNTITDTCNMCHDGTGGGGVYGVLASRGVTVTTSHRIDVTNIVPLGDPTTGGPAPVQFGGTADRPMTCTDCHSPHGAAVAAFTGDRARTATDAITPRPKSDRLLKKRPGAATSAVAYYGSDWCVACHQGAAGVSASHDHPVGRDSSAYYYDNVMRMASDDSTDTWVRGSLGGSNRGYLMTAQMRSELTATIGASGPICQQCHEDARYAGVADTWTADVATFSVTSPDGANPLDNPRFQVFPHESAAASMLIEPTVAQDLCQNCH
jgi:hypothetical protein